MRSSLPAADPLAGQADRRTVFLSATRLKQAPVKTTTSMSSQLDVRVAGTRHAPHRPALVMTDVHKSYRDVNALRGVDLEIEAGEIVALLGANAAGKTTLISIAGALCRPEAGSVWVDGVNMLTDPEKGRRGLGLATQETGVYPRLSVRDNLRFFGELAGLRRKMLDGRLESVAEAFGLSAVLDMETRVLSVGEIRRLHTAMIMLGRPPLLLLDEPTTGVDVGTRARMLQLVRELAMDGTAVCYSTHYLVEAEQLGASVAVLHHGRIVARDTVQALVGCYGQSAIELTFDGPAPQIDNVHKVQRSEATLRLATDQGSAHEVASLFAALGESISRLRDVRLIQPNLESVFLALTGQVPTLNSDRHEVKDDA
jgi:ABC-2 type transport system ATP-binding protein